MRQIATRTVTIKATGAAALINDEDFDAALHADRKPGAEDDAATHENPDADAQGAGDADAGKGKGGRGVIKGDAKWTKEQLTKLSVSELKGLPEFEQIEDPTALKNKADIIAAILAL